MTEKPKMGQILVYTPDSQMRTPGLLFKSMWQDLKGSHELARRLFIRDITAQYRQSIFGILWAFVPPLITSVIFILLQSNNVLNIGETEVPYPVYVLVGTILWQVFSESLNAPLKSVTASKTLLAKIYFPRESLIIAAIYTTIFNLIIKMILLVILLIYFHVQLTWGLLFAVIPIFMLLFLGIGLGLLVTPFGMLYTDVAIMLPIIVQLGFFVTPVVYPPPESFPLSLIATLNPVSPFLIAARDLITLGTMTKFNAFIIDTVFTLLILLMAWLLYRVSLPVIIERMSA
jgi:lipopolysaccharide transport system permease protein